MSYIYGWASELTDEGLARAVAEAFDFFVGGFDAAVRHRHLESRTRAFTDLSRLGSDGLNNEVNVPRFPPEVGPEADVDLVGIDEGPDYVGHARKKWPELGGLIGCEIPDVNTMAFGFDDECA